jgi:hypothetical protein
MHATHPVFLALLVISNVTLADPPLDSSVTSVGSEPVVLAQAEPANERTRRINDEARRDVDESRRESQRAPTDDESLALAALEGLMAQPPERSLPIIKKVLAGSQSTLVKRRALFVLSQIHNDEAQALLIETAKASGPLRREAIRNIGIGGNPKSLALLKELYDGGDASTKKQVLQAWLISGRKNEVYQAVVDAKSDAEANEAIRILSVMGAKEELRKLGDLKRPGYDLAQAYAISGDVASLKKIIDGGGALEARSDAVRKLGIIHNEDARKALREIYGTTTSDEIKKSALQGMLINGDDEGVLALYKNSKSTEEKRALLRTLSFMNSDAALQAIDAALEDKQ